VKQLSYSITICYSFSTPLSRSKFSTSQHGNHPFSRVCITLRQLVVVVSETFHIPFDNVALFFANLLFLSADQLNIFCHLEFPEKWSTLLELITQLPLYTLVIFTMRPLKPCFSRNFPLLGLWFPLEYAETWPLVVHLAMSISHNQLMVRHNYIQSRLFVNPSYCKTEWALDSMNFDVLRKRPIGIMWSQHGVCREMITCPSLGYAYVNFQQPADAKITSGCRLIVYSSYCSTEWALSLLYWLSESWVVENFISEVLMQ
jgi:hypothetical protein